MHCCSQCRFRYYKVGFGKLIDSPVLFFFMECGLLESGQGIKSKNCIHIGSLENINFKINLDSFKLCHESLIDTKTYDNKHLSHDGHGYSVFIYIKFTLFNYYKRHCNITLPLGMHQLNKVMPMCLWWGQCLWCATSLGYDPDFHAFIVPV